MDRTWVAYCVVKARARERGLAGRGQIWVGFRTEEDDGRVLKLFF